MPLWYKMTEPTHLQQLESLTKQLTALQHARRLIMDGLTGNAMPPDIDQTLEAMQATQLALSLCIETLLQHAGIADHVEAVVKQWREGLLSLHEFITAMQWPSFPVQEIRNPPDGLVVSSNLGNV